MTTLPPQRLLKEAEYAVECQLCGTLIRGTAAELAYGVHEHRIMVHVRPSIPVNLLPPHWVKGSTSTVAAGEMDVEQIESLLELDRWLRTTFGV